MLKKLSKTLLAISCLALFSCGGNKDEEVDLTAPAGMNYLDISKTGMNLYILIPDSSKGKPDTILQNWGAYEVKVGKDFQISVEEGNGDIAALKADNANNDVNVVKKYIIDEPTTLLWESGIGDLSEFHFYHIAKVGERSYVFSDIKGDAFDQKAAQAMLDACKAVKEKKVAAKENS